MADASPSRCRRPICGRTTFPRSRLCPDARRDKRLIPVTDKRGATCAEFDAYRCRVGLYGGRTPIDRAVELQSRRREDDTDFASATMLKLAPPVWALIYLLFAGAMSWLLGWPKVPRLPLAPLGITLVAVAVIPPVSAVVLFRREGTEINPTSMTHRKLITSGPYRLTRNPMYLGLVTLTIGIAAWVGTWPMFITPIAVFATTNWAHIPFEEAKMRRQFGCAYDGYVGGAPVAMR